MELLGYLALGSVAGFGGSPHPCRQGYRGHNHPHGLRVCISGLVRRVTASIRRVTKRRAAAEPVIGHVKAEHRIMDSCSRYSSTRARGKRIYQGSPAASN
jgi:hypothetical protein